jgi:hypothetical protein
MMAGDRSGAATDFLAAAGLFGCTDVAFLGTR